LLTGPDAEVSADVVGEATNTVLVGDDHGRCIGVRCADQAALGNGIAEANGEQVVEAAHPFFTALMAE